MSLQSLQRSRQPVTSRGLQGTDLGFLHYALSPTHEATQRPGRGDRLALAGLLVAGRDALQPPADPTRRQGARRGAAWLGRAGVLGALRYFPRGLDTDSARS